jgi:lipopolysaccharide transport system permease protein
MKTREQPDTALPVITIRPLRGWVPVNLGEMWEYRELLFFLTLREIKLRYKQTILGFAWAIIQPFMMMVAFTLFFGQLARIPSEGIPYPLFSYAALLPWTLFAEGINRSSASLLTNNALVQKIYCPRLIMPVAGILSPVVDFIIAFIILVCMMFYYGYTPGLGLLWVPVFVLITVITSLGVGLWIAPLSARYRDFQYVIPFLVQIWLFASPVVYAASLLPSRFQTLFGLNPMVGVIEGFRWALLGTKPPEGLMAVSAGIVALFLVSGAFYFRRMEKTFADVI